MPNAPQGVKAFDDYDYDVDDGDVGRFVFIH